MASSRHILLVNADTRAGLAAVRSLARVGFKPIVAVESTDHFTCASSALKTADVVPMRQTGTLDQQAEHLIDLARSRNCSAILPITDRAISIFAHSVHSLPHDMTLVTAKRSSLLNVLDKRDHLALARGLGIPCPEHVQLTTSADIAMIAQHQPLPWIAKLAGKSPCEEVREQPPLLEIDTVATAHRHIESLTNGRYIVQRHYRGKIHNLCVFAEHGSVRAAHQYVSVRRSRGSAILRRIIAPDERCLAYTKKILGALEWDGVANVQFIVDDETDDVRYLETNGRFWASIQGSINAGWDFPKWAVEYALDASSPTPPRLQVGSLTCYRAADLETLIAYLRGGPSPVTDERPSVYRAIGSYLGTFRPSVHNDVFQFFDPYPGIVDHWSRFKSFIRNRRFGS